ncbi:MAG: restriction endonuclease subunit S [Ignavibacteriae bacterium]|nr:restriction endonuclease subunit S [Saprospiraceae bacterium]MCB0752739.1 restriction endonuclease subunit S [Ignavibacteriota bacterium]
MTNDNNIPQHWKTVITADIIDVRDGTHDTPKYVTENGVPLVTSKNLKANKIDFERVSFISYEDHLEISKRSKVEEGDILFAMIGTIGNPAIIKGDANFSIKNVGLFKKNESVILPAFLVNFLRSSIFEKQLSDKKLLKGTTQKFIPLGNLRKIILPLPPLPEQQAIVAKLEELLSELENGKQQLLTAQQQLKVYRQSLLKWAFEGKEKTTVGELFDFIGGGTPSKKNPKYWQGKIPWASVKDVKGDYLNKTQDNISEEGLKDSASNLAKPNDVILITRISPGKTIITKIETAINQDLKIVKPKFETTPKFIFYVFKSIEWECVKKSSGTTVLGINLTNLKEIKVPKISIEEQRFIVSELESKLTVCDKIEETISQSLQQAETLKQSILKKAFEGKLVTTEKMTVVNELH